MSTAAERTIEHVPTFNPTEEEFARPLEYFTKLRDAGRTYGIVRIVTPEKWRPKEAPKTDEPFDSYRQTIHALKTGRDFENGDENFTEESYRAYADRLKEKWIQQHPNLKLDLSAYVVDATEMQCRFSATVERAYWDMVEGVTKDKFEVDYASNHPVKKTDPPEDSGWDLSSLVHQEGNLLNMTNLDIPGVTRPWLYYGCLFSTFCWHVEDHFMYSVNYLHAGASKIWFSLSAFDVELRLGMMRARYGIPSSSAEVFEEYITSSVSTRSRKSDILSRLTMMLSPHKFPESIAVFKAVQNPGDMILTFPRAFHGGYNEGWNCAEAVNFAVLDWVLFGLTAIKLYNSPNCSKEPLFSHDKLLWLLMAKKEADEEDNTLAAKSIPMELRRAVKEACRIELKERRRIRASLHNVRQAIPKRRWEISWDTWYCEKCKAPLFFSYCTCGCRVQNAEVLCSHHALQADAFRCGCDPYLCLERTDEEIQEMLESAKYESAIQSPE